jgi:ligand-binding sensor domain-containing protein/signal transduction histidine kinase
MARRVATACLFPRKLISKWAVACAAVFFGTTIPGRGSILWSDLGATLVRESGPGADLLSGAIQRDDFARDTLYFKFHVDPLSDVSTEEYMAGFQLFEGDVERLGVGNSFKAWAYSVYNAAGSGEFNKVFGDIDLKSARPESSSPGVFLPYELPRRGIESTVIFKVDYVPGGDDAVTVWLNPDLAPGATESSQAQSVVTTFSANASFNQLRLRHTGGGGGWTFSDMAIATSFNDFVIASGAVPGTSSAGRGAMAFNVRTWQQEQGLPENSVHALLQTRDGYLWVGGDDGVARFDGVRFLSFGLREGLRSGPVRALFEDVGGDLWIGTGAGLARRHAGRFITYTTGDGLPGEAITALAGDGREPARLWVGTESGLAICQEKNGRPSFSNTQFKGKVITALFKDHHGVLWVGVRGAGIFRLQKDQDQFAPLTDPTIDSLLAEPHCLLVDHANRIWVGAGDDFVLCQEEGQWRRYRISRHLARPYISSLAEQPDGAVWAGSVNEGLLQFKEGRLAAFNAASGLPDNLVESLLVDREGNLWVGTGAGLSRLRHKSLSTFGPNEGLGYGAVYGLAEVAPGIVWAAKPGDGLFRWEGRNFIRSTRMPAGSPEINAMLVTRDGACWAAMANGLLRLANPAEDSMENPPLSLAGLNVLSLAEDATGSLWAGTRQHGLWRMEGERWTAQTNLAVKSPITAIVHDREEATWIGTEGDGLYRLSKGTQTHFNKAAGMLSDSVRGLFLDSNGTVWIGTAGGGISQWRNGHLITFTSREGLPDNTISQILEDGFGSLWLGTKRGIARVSKTELEDLATGKISSLYPQLYGRFEGMLSEECTGGFHPAGLKTKAGLLWFSTLKGVVVADPRPQPAPSPPPAVVLELVLVDGTEIRPTKAPPRSGQKPDNSNRPKAPQPTVPVMTPAKQVEIPPGKHQLELHYTGLSFSAPERVRFRYRLEGLDPDWVEAGSRRAAFYSYVPPGNYRFQVIACNSDGVWNSVGDGVGLTVLPHLWQAWWFIVLATMASLGAAVGVARVVEKKRVRSHVKVLEQERTLERERTRIAQDLHDDLGSSLTRISLLSHLAKVDKDNPGQVEVHAQKISQSAAQTVRALEEIVWALRPGSDSVQSLIEYIAHFANEMFEGDSTRCRLDLPHSLPARALPPEMRHNIFLIVKEALTNALKHSAAQEVRVIAKVSDLALEIVVEDNGRGFELGESPGDDEGHGLGNMRRRAAAMGGTLDMRSAKGQGTRVRLEVHFQEGVPA